MFCTKCGSQIPGDGSFCAKCGASGKNTQPHPVNANYIPSSQINNSNDQKDSSKPGFFKRWWKVIVPVAVLACAAGVGLFIFMSNYAPLLDLQSAFNNLDVELTERVEASPLMAIAVLSDTVENGTTSVFFDHMNSWGIATRGDIDFIADRNNHEYALLGSVTLPLFPIVDFEAHLNRDRMAFGSRMLPGNDFYGITFRTFRNDLQRISAIFGDIFDMEALADYVESIERLMNVDMVTLDDILEPYNELLVSFIRNAQHSSGNEDMIINGEEVRSSVVTFTFTEADIISLLRDFYGLLARDSNLRTQFDLSQSYFMAGIGPGMSYSEFLSEIRQSINELEQDLSGEMTMSFYLNGNNRLMRATILLDMVLDQEDLTTAMVADLGLSSQDTWTFSVTEGSGANAETSIVRWEFLQITPASYEHTLSFIMERGTSQDTLAIFRVEWDSNSGDFTLHSIESSSNTSIEGRFITNNDGRSRLRLDSIPLGHNEYLSLDINMSPETDIRPIEFVDISSMTLEVISDIFSYMFALLIGASLW
ncbi:MAG: zinc ribbon domain-containing protein [Defluviitaleaceae bacterium]|nr:zinc ribbon domain-containing protein [Defluviitaleaceae bacterium]